MPIARFQMPDGKVARFEVPEGTTPEQANAMMQAHFSIKALPGDESAPEPSPGGPLHIPQALPSGGDSTVKRALAGAALGVSDIGNTALNVLAYLPSKVSLTVDQWNKTRNADFEALTEQNKDNTAFKVGRVGGNVAATLPVGGVLGKGVQGLASLPSLAKAAPQLGRLASAVSSGGFKTGANLAADASRSARLADMGVRMAGGAITGGASAGLVNQDDAGMGAVVGGVLPPALKGVGKVAGVAGGAVREALMPQASRSARTVMQAAEAQTPEQIAALRAALTQQGPSMIPGSVPTVPMIVQAPGVAQLQRTVENVGAKALPAREAANNTARIAALNRISPVTGTVQQAAENMGNMTQRFARGAEADATEKVGRLYDMVDPMDEGRVLLPINEMEAAKDTFLGRGTFGSGSRANAAIDTARNIGTETVPEVQQMSTKGMQDLVLAVRAAGGINTSSKSGRELAGEIRNLRESGLNNIVRPNKGVSVERMAETMHEAGFLPDNDPATLLELLHRSAGGDKVYASRAEDAYRAAMESAQGMPPPGGTFDKAVPFNELQNLRSSIGEAAAQAEAKGNTREAAALKQMVGQIDSRVNKVSHGSWDGGEYFPPQMATRWRAANAAHADKMDRFHTGPQQAMFRQGGDGLPSAQGAELAGKFFNAARSQADDAKAFKRLVGDNEPLIASLKNYAITDLAGQTDKFGRLNNLKFNNWMDGRSGALRETFVPDELSLLGQVGKEVKAADLGATTGIARGSNTMQNAANALQLGVLDNKLVTGLAHRVPVVGRLAGPLLDGLRETARRGKASQLDELLADPLKLDQAIGEYLKAMQPGKIGVKTRGLLESASPAAYRTAPLLRSDQ